MYAELSIRTEGDALLPLRIILVAGETRIVGRARARGASLALNGTAVSRLHAALELSSAGLRVTDLGSLNGTFVDGERLEPRSPHLLTPGQVVNIGEFEIRSRIERSPTTRLDLTQGLLPPGEFELHGELGKGSSGNVWSAYQRTPGRMVAIKFLQGRDPGSEKYKRFKREAKLAQVESQHIVTIYDMCVHDETPYLLMEFVPGPSAFDLMQERVLTIGDVLAIGAGLAKALVALEAAGVVHRDIKPANVLLSPDGTAKLTDFGIAKSLEDAATPLTKSDIGLGTLPFVAPEVANKATDADPRSDVYSLGATLYALISGQPPIGIKKRTLLEVLREIFEGTPVRLETLREDCPLPVADFVHSLLEKEPGKRPSASQVAERLESLEMRYPDGPDEVLTSDTECLRPVVAKARDKTIVVLLGELCVQRVDALVTPANGALTAEGDPVNKSVHKVGGEALSEACKAAATCAPGQAVATIAGKLGVKRVIHTVPPVLSRDNALLAQAYRRSLEVAEEEGCSSIALPSLSGGAYGFPPRRGATVALTTIVETLLAGSPLTDVRCCLTNQQEVDAYVAVLREIVEQDDRLTLSG